MTLIFLVLDSVCVSACVRACVRTCVRVYPQEDILIEIEVVEVNESPYARALLGNFSLVVNTTHLFTNHPDWDTYDFDNNVIRYFNTHAYAYMHVRTHAHTQSLFLSPSLRSEETRCG